MNRSAVRSDARGVPAIIADVCSTKSAFDHYVASGGAGWLPVHHGGPVGDQPSLRTDCDDGADFCRDGDRIACEGPTSMIATCLRQMR